MFISQALTSMSELHFPFLGNIYIMSKYLQLIPVWTVPLSSWFPVCSTGVWLDDEGLYICEAKNQFGTIKTEARVSVTGLGRLV